MSVKSKPVILIQLPQTEMSAKEFIKLFDALLDAETPDEENAAIKALKAKRATLTANQKQLGCTPEAKN